MGAPALQWSIAKSKLPSFLKLTLHTLALVADPGQGFANVYFSKSTIGELSSRSERIAREDVADLVTLGVLACVEPSRGGKPSRYQIIFERLASWSDEDTRKIAEIRRFRRERYPKNHDLKPGSVQPGMRKRKRRSNPDPYSRGTRIRTAGEPGSVQPRIFPSEYPSESTAGAGDRRSVDAAENELAGPADTLDREPRSSSSPRAGAGDGDAFRLLAEYGRRLLAENGEGPIAWSELRAELSRFAIRQSFASDLPERVESFLQIQHSHFRERLALAPHGEPEPTKGVPAAPPKKSRVRPAGEVSP